MCLPQRPNIQVGANRIRRRFHLVTRSCSFSIEVAVYISKCKVFVRVVLMHFPKTMYITNNIGDSMLPWRRPDSVVNQCPLPMCVLTLLLLVCMCFISLLIVVGQPVPCIMYDYLHRSGAYHVAHTKKDTVSLNPFSLSHSLHQSHQMRQL